jgi:hypothetical protein
MIRRTTRFTDLVERQLDLLLADEADLLSEAELALATWRDADRDGAEEAYGDYQLVVDAIADRLLDVCEGYASTLADDADAEYRQAFARDVARRFRRHASIVADLAADP